MTFTLFISPKAQKRPRSRAINHSGKSFAMTYKDAGQRKEEDKLITLLYAHKPPVPLSEAIELTIRAYLPIPTSKPRKWRENALQGYIRPTTKPDADNLAKQLLDVMNGVFFTDDKLIVSLSIEKHYGDVPRWEIQLLPIWK